MNRDSFVMYASSLDILDLLSKDQAATLFLAIREYVKGRDLPELDQVTQVAFLPIKNQIDRDVKKYDEICEKRREAGAKGGRPKKEASESKKTNCFSEEEEQASETDTNTNTNTETDTNTNTETEICVIADKPQKKRASRFTPPSIEEVREYCLERGNGIDPERFVNFYESKGWLIGKNRMKDWRAAVRNWERINNDNKPQDIVSQRLEALKGFGGEAVGLFE